MDERYDMMRSAMDRRWLYIRNFRPDLPYVQPLTYMFQARGYQSWARLASEGKLTPGTAMFWGEKPSEELYDMEADPENVHNRAADPTCRETLDRMRSALEQRAIANRDNGFLPEGSALEGYEASRAPGAVPMERVYAMARLASERNRANLPTFIEALEDRSEPIRWWAAQGCTMLRERAVAAEAALRRRLGDESGAVQVAAAEALARLGRADVALPVFQRWLERTDNPAFSLQAANVLDRIGEAARPMLPSLKKALVARKAEGEVEGNLARMLTHLIDVLEGRKKGLGNQS
jgi:hypothetical protein